MVRALGLELVCLDFSWHFGGVYGRPRGRLETRSREFEDKEKGAKAKSDSKQRREYDDAVLGLKKRAKTMWILTLRSVGCLVLAVLEMFRISWVSLIWVLCSSSATTPTVAVSRYGKREPFLAFALQFEFEESRFLPPRRFCDISPLRLFSY